MGEDLDLWRRIALKYRVAFERHWRFLVAGFLVEHREVDGILVKFEDFVSGKFHISSLQHHIGMNALDSCVLTKNVAGPEEQTRRRKYRVSDYDRMVLKAICGPMMKRLGYA